MKTIFKLLTTALLLLCTLTINAQPDWQWGKRGGSGGSSPGDEVVDMATDQNGNVYVLSVCSAIGTVNVDGHPGITPYDRMSVASWNCNGEFRWLKMFGSGTGATGSAIYVDTLGGVYIAGTMVSSVTMGGPGYFDTDTVLPVTNKRMYLIKYDTSGNYQWLKMPQPDTLTVGGAFGGVFDMDGTPNGDLYLYTLLIPGLYDGGAFAVADTGMYIWKMNKEGVFQSLTRLEVTVSGTYLNNYGYANLGRAHFKRDHHSGRYYLTGYYDNNSGNLAFSETSFGDTAKFYLAAFGSDGSSLWAKMNTGNGSSGINYRPAIDESGNIYIGGGAGANLSFNGYVFTSSTMSGLPFVIATDSNGNLLWGSHGKPQNAQCVTKAIAYANGVVGAVGNYAGTLLWDDENISTVTSNTYIFLSRLNAATGDVIRLDSIKSNSLQTYASAAAVDKNGNFYAGGRFASALYVASDTLLKTSGPYDWFVAKFGTANCNCTLPIAHFSYSTSGTAINFSYTGSTDYSSISWDFGDGTTATTANPSHTFSDTGVHMVCVTVINDCGSNIYCLEVAAPTGIENTGSAAAGVRVYPNPASQSITVAGAGSGTKLLLYDVTGVLVLEQSLSNSLPVSLNISQLPDGVYVLQFTDSKGKRGMTKVVKR